MKILQNIINRILVSVTKLKEHRTIEIANRFDCRRSVVTTKPKKRIYHENKVLKE